jgi:hypothetical protein
LREADVEVFSRLVELALFMQAKLDLAIMTELVINHQAARMFGLRPDLNELRPPRASNSAYDLIPTGRRGT